MPQGQVNKEKALKGEFNTTGHLQPVNLELVQYENFTHGHKKAFLSLSTLRYYY